MTAVQTTELEIALSGPVPIDVTDGFRNTSRVERHGLPTVQPGQLWLVELPPGEAELAPLEHHAVTAANVVIYDRELASTVARLLPLGGYAEPAPAGDEEGEAALERCVGFVRDGWSVARLVRPTADGNGGRADEFRRLSERLLAFNLPAALPVSVFTSVGGGAYEGSRARLDRLAGGVDARSFYGCGAVAIVFDAVEARAESRFSIAPANGLAG